MNYDDSQILRQSVIFASSILLDNRIARWKLEWRLAQSQTELQLLVYLDIDLSDETPMWIRSAGPRDGVEEFDLGLDYNAITS